MSEFIRLDGEDVVVKLRGSALKDEDLDSDLLFTHVLQDVITVLEAHPLSRKAINFNLCPRWQLKSEDRRDIFVTMSNGTIPIDSVRLGTIRLTNCSHKHGSNIDGEFRLSFHPDGSRIFITAEEFLEYYNKQII